MAENGEWARSLECFQSAVRMAHEIGQADATAEAQLALAKFRLNQLTEPCREAERLAKAKSVSHRALANLWFAIGEGEQAKIHAISAYKSAWADGEPFGQRFRLNQAIALLKQFGAAIPVLPPYDPLKDENLPWEDEIVTAIRKAKVMSAPRAAIKEVSRRSVGRKQ